MDGRHRPREDTGEGESAMKNYPKPPEVRRLWERDNESVKSFCGGSWRIRDLLAATADLPVFDLPLSLFPFNDHSFDAKDIYEFAQHYIHVRDADPDEPVVMDELGRVIDGRHRLVKALIEGRESVPCRKIPQGTKPSVQ